ncbi:hypothetical protein BJX70DRAFT_294191 [Aspergillus crustosus]
MEFQLGADLFTSRTRLTIRYSGVDTSNPPTLPSEEETCRQFDCSSESNLRPLAPSSRLRVQNQAFFWMGCMHLFGSPLLFAVFNVIRGCGGGAGKSCNLSPGRTLSVFTEAAVIAERPGKSVARQDGKRR